jgi:alpha/beta superfamily hydrolase
VSNFSNAGGALPGELRALTFAGPAGPLEGLWKEADGRPLGSAVFAHPHPLHAGTLHNKVVYRAARALTHAGYGTLRFNFRGVGLSAGVFDEGRGESEDFRAAMTQAEALGGLPLVGGGFSFGAAVALRAIEKDPRVIAFVGAGLPLATSSGRDLPRPSMPALFLVGSEDTFGPPDLLRRFAGESASIVEVAGTDHFFADRLDRVEAAIAAFLAELRVPAPVP